MTPCQLLHDDIKEAGVFCALIPLTLIPERANVLDDVWMPQLFQYPRLCHNLNRAQNSELAPGAESHLIEFLLGIHESLLYHLPTQRSLRAV